MKENFLVTGGSGYVGKLLLKKLINDERVGYIIVIDKDELVTDLKQNPKVFFLHKNLVDDWEKEVRGLEEKNNFKLTKVVHLAWQIRTMFGKQKLQNHWNIDGSQKVFEFVKNTSSVNTLVHFSTVASYGAFSENTFEKVFTEKDPFRKTNYLYAEEKRIVEENLDKMNFGNTNVYVIRPASITGPSGRERTSFGLQSALSGKIKNENLLFRLISKVLQFMPATVGWARQFVYEDDIVQAILVMCFAQPQSTFSPSADLKVQKYNLCPPYRAGERNYIDAREMGEMLGKKVIYLPPILIRLLCSLAWHGTMGKIPTSPGVWKAYSYPIVVDGTKIERDFPNFKYQKDIRQAYRN